MSEGSDRQIAEPSQPIRSLNIAFVVETLGAGGAEHAVLNLARALRAKGHRCVVIALMVPLGLRKDFEAAGFAVHCLHLRHRWDLFRAIRRLKHLVREARVNVLHGHLFFGGVYVALLPGNRGLVKCVTFHNLGYETFPARTLWHRIRKRLDRWLMHRRIDIHFAPSSVVADHYKRHLQLDEINVIPNPLPEDLIADSQRPDHLRKHVKLAGVDPSLPRVLVPARLIPEKGHRFIISALKLLEDIDLVCMFAGDGPLRQEISTSLANEETRKILVLGNVEHDFLIRLMFSSDMCISASTHEGFGLAIAEAMAVGTSVIVTRIPAFVELVTHDVTGLVVEPGDATALASAMKELLQNEELRRRLGTAAQGRVARILSPARVAALMSDLYQLAIDRSR